MKSYTKLAFVGLAALTLAACEPPKQTADTIQRRAQEQLSSAATMSVGMPAITHFAERRMMKDILEMRDRMVPTHTYLVSEVNGSIGEKVCDSLGFGLPGATQFTNPQYIAERGANYGYAILPQADPNGLFSPTQMDGTWVMCKVPGTDRVSPQFIEPKVIVLTFPKEARK